MPHIERLSEFDDLSLSLNGGKKSVLFGFSATLFYEDGSTVEGRLRGNRILADYLQIFRDKINYFHPANARSHRKIDKIDPLDYYDKYARQADSADIYGAGLYGFPTRESLQDATPYYIGNVGVDDASKWSYVTAYFPASWVETVGYGVFTETILRWCDILKPSHGTAGFSILFDEGGAIQHQSRLAFPVFSRFPGMDVPDIGSWTLEFTRQDKRWIRTTNWLTILDDDFVENLGGLQQLRSEIDQQGSFHPWQGGVVIQAGSEPKLGDINRGDIPEIYRTVARATKKVRFDAFAADSTITAINPPEPLDPHEETLKWFRRFD